MITKFVAAALFAATALTGASAATVVNFDDLSGFSTIPTLYAGIDWQDNFVYYDSPQNPYNPHSGNTRIFASYDKFQVGDPGPYNLKVGAGSVFDGFWTAGNGAPVSFSLYEGGVLKATSATLVIDSTPTFLASNYTGTIDEIRITSFNGQWIADDFTFSTLNALGAVPEPATWALMIGGFAMTGVAARRRRTTVAA